MTVPLIGKRYRGVDGRTGYLLRQAWQAFSGAMDDALRKLGINGPQYAVLSVLDLDPGLSGAELARACNTTPQAMNGVLRTLEREGLITRGPHPTHGRILQTNLTDDGKRRLEAATPHVRALEAAIEEGLSARELAAVKAWLVVSAERAGSHAEDSR